MQAFANQIRGCRMAKFKIDPRLEADSLPLGRLALCELRLMNDSRWPWLMLVPMRNGASELHDLAPADQALLWAETAMAGKALKDAASALKINTGALGNIVRQLHVHVVARSEGDPNWPGPVWGFGARQPYAAGAAGQLAARLSALLPITEILP
jgi:diadenosine tetraphosphate (Ap4A) HIT family hydrolase